MVSDKADDDLAATVATKFGELDRHKVDAYWNLVRRCLKEVFGKNEHEVRASIRNFNSRAKLLTEENILLLHHSSPLQIAANLAGAGSRPLTPDEKLKYVAIINENRDDRPDEKDIKKAYPDDLTRA